MHFIGIFFNPIVKKKKNKRIKKRDFLIILFCLTNDIFILSPAQSKCPKSIQIYFPSIKCKCRERGVENNVFLINVEN